ncbi:MAG: M23 family metallopeptidase [Hyphomonadaceae bacterium]
MTLTQSAACAGALVSALCLYAMFTVEPVEQARAAPPLEHEQALKKRERSSAVTTRSGLIIPVAGIRASDLTDTWGASRSEGRLHEGIDIMAPFGAPVRAVAGGRIVRFFDSVRGGVTIYQFDSTDRFVYYYAHLSRRAPGLAEGDAVEQGEVIGYVGMSGNAPVPHLHFEIQRLTPSRRWWEADSMNPYPLLVAGRAPN